MKEFEKKIIEENLDTVDEVIELIPEKTGFNFKKAGGVAIVVGAIVALGYGAYKLIEKKKEQKALEADCTSNAQACDFEDEEYTAE